jgi:acetyl-CoA synthetase
MAEIIDEDGNKKEPGESGMMCVTRPWPSMIRGVWGDPERFVKSYFSDAKKDGKPVYFTGDGAVYDEDGYITITGRMDDVINVSGHRMGTAEIEAACKKHTNVAEVAVVAKPHELKGESIFSYIVLKEQKSPEESLGISKEINNIIKKEIGNIAVCDDIVFVPGLPTYLVDVYITTVSCIVNSLCLFAILL